MTTKRSRGIRSCAAISSRAVSDTAMSTSALRAAPVMTNRIPAVVILPKVRMRKNVTSWTVTTEGSAGHTGPVDANEWSRSTRRRRAAALTAICSASSRRSRWPSSNGKWTMRAKSVQAASRSARAPWRVVKIVSSSSGCASMSAGTSPCRYVSTPPETPGARNSALRPTWSLLDTTAS
jgi:hypothetical protein